MPDSTRESVSFPPADPAMAGKLAVNRTGRLTASQRRLALIVGIVALLCVLCPLTMVVQAVALVVAGDVPVPTLGGVVFTGLGVFFVVLFAGLIGSNVSTFLPEAFMRRPVRYARGPLMVHVSEGHRPELPYSYIIGDYSFAPFIAPPDVPMQVGAPYIVYYSARSRLLLSLAALDAPDGAQWEPSDPGDSGK